MKFLLDAQLPKKLSLFLVYRGHDDLHTLDLPHKNRSKDSELNTFSVEDKRVLISKDMDFVESLLISDKPYKLLYVNTGNIHNKELQEIFASNLEKLVEALEEYRFVELTNERIVVHE